MLLYSCGHHHTASAVVLDNGNKWAANPETTTGINNMINMVEAFASSDDSQAYKKLESTLSDEFTMIFKNCTMQGEAHNQLHNYLLPIKDLFDGLKSKELKTQQDSFEKLKNHLNLYATFFK